MKTLMRQGDVRDELAQLVIQQTKNHRFASPDEHVTVRVPAQLVLGLILTNDGDVVPNRPDESTPPSGGEAARAEVRHG